MAVTRKPMPRAADAALSDAVADEAKVREFIERGGKVAGEEQLEVARKLVQLRLPHELLVRVDRALKARTVPPSRHNWFLEAIYEKLAREENHEARERPAP